MSTDYDTATSPQRPETRETQDAIDLGFLRVLADNLADVAAPLRIVEPRDLDACGDCPDELLNPDPAVAEVVYRVGAWTYREPACEAHVYGVVRWHRRYRRTAMWVEIPAPAAAPPSPANVYRDSTSHTVGSRQWVEARRGWYGTWNVTELSDSGSTVHARGLLTRRDAEVIAAAVAATRSSAQ